MHKKQLHEETLTQTELLREKKTAPNFKPRLVTVENNSHRSADGWMCGWMIWVFIHLYSRRGIISSIFLLHQPLDTNYLTSIRQAISSIIFLLPPHNTHTFPHLSDKARSFIYFSHSPKLEPKPPLLYDSIRGIGQL